MLKLITPKNRSLVQILRKEHIDFINNPHSFSIPERDLSAPPPVTFSFEPAISATLTLCDSHGNERSYQAKNGKAEIYNLKVGESYSWYVSTGFMRSETYSFTTDSTAPRLLYVDGLSNVRDIGGFRTTGGRLIKQGMVYRSTEGDKNYSITENGLKALTDELEIRAELDVRGINGESFGEIFRGLDVKRYNVALSAYGEIFTDTQKLAYSRVFELLADKSNYPLLVHCQSGMDRPRTLLFILCSLLGMDEGDAMLDYEMSSFSTWGNRSRDSAQFCEFMKKFHSYGKSAEQAANGFLISCGIQQKTLDTVRDILIED